MSKRFYPPRFDYVFKRIFGDKNNTRILAAFLMAALNLPEEDFAGLIIVDPHLRRGSRNDKLGILDVKVLLKSGGVIDVEIQVKLHRGLRERIVFTAAKMLAGQLRRGEPYERLGPATSIIICGGVLLPEEPGYYNSYGIRNIRSGRELVDLLRINILETAKLPAEPDGSSLFNWGQFFKAKTREELAMVARTDPIIGEAVAQVLELNEDEAERMLAEDRWRWQMDQAARMRDSYEDGLEAGEKKAKARYQPVLEENRAIRYEIEAKDRAIEAKDRAIEAVDEIEALKQKLRELGIDS